MSEFEGYIYDTNGYTAEENIAWQKEWVRYSAQGSKTYRKQPGTTSVPAVYTVPPKRPPPQCELGKKYEALKAEKRELLDALKDQRANEEKIKLLDAMLARAKAENREATSLRIKELELELEEYKGDNERLYREFTLVPKKLEEETSREEKK